jgi:ribosomal protein S7
MLISYNFYNSILLQKMLNQFVRRGQKEKVEIIFYRFITRFARTKNFLAFWLLLTVVELHKPVLAFLTTKHKNKIVYKPRYKVHQAALLSVGLK